MLNLTTLKIHPNYDLGIRHATNIGGVLPNSHAGDSPLPAKNPEHDITIGHVAYDLGYLEGIQNPGSYVSAEFKAAYDMLTSDFELNVRKNGGHFEADIHHLDIKNPSNRFHPVGLGESVRIAVTDLFRMLTSQNDPKERLIFNTRMAFVREVELRYHDGKWMKYDDYYDMVRVSKMTCI